MAERLTDKTARTTKPASDDLVHMVDVSNTTQNPAGSSFKMEIKNFLKGRAFIPVQGCYTLKESSNESTSSLEAGDLVIYEDVTSDVFIVATIKAAITIVPDDLRDSTKAARWIDNSAML